MTGATCDDVALAAAMPLDTAADTVAAMPDMAATTAFVPDSIAVVVA